MPINPATPNIPSLNFSDPHARAMFHSHLEKLDSSESVLFKHTHLEKVTAECVSRVLGSPSESVLDKTIRLKLIEGTEHVQPLRTVDKTKRPEEYFKGKMTSRHVPTKTRRPPKAKLSTGSRIPSQRSDIGYVHVPDRHGNRCFVLFKDLHSQYVTFYRMKRKK